MNRIKATLNDNNAKLDHLDKSIKEAYEKRHKLIKKNKSITYDVLSELYGKERQELTALIDTAEQNSSDVTAFLKVVHKYEHIEKLTPEIMHKLIEKIVVHAPDKSSGKRIQQIEIYYRFDVATASLSLETGKYGKKDA